MGKQSFRIGILAGVLLCAFAGVEGAQYYKRLQLRQVTWDRVPKQLGAWEGQNAHFSPLFGKDPADATLLRVYIRRDVAPITVYAGFHSDLSDGLEVHTPELCYPAQGWHVISEEKCALGAFRGKGLLAREIVVGKEQERRLVVWWYFAGSQPFEERIRRVYGMMIQAMLTGRTDGALVRLETPIESTGTQGARDRIVTFARLLIPALENALPQ